MLIGDTIILSLKNNLNITFTNNSTKRNFYILNTFIVIMVGNMIVLGCS